MNSHRLNEDLEIAFTIIVTVPVLFQIALFSWFGMKKGLVINR
jgi:hypothetical protein